MTGTAGIGKSRLSEALRERIVRMGRELQAERPIVMAFHGSPHHPNTAFYPITRQLERMADIGQADAVEAKHRKLAKLFERGGAGVEAETLALLADLLAIKPYPASLALAITPKVKRQRTIEALRQTVGVVASRRPVLLLFEDLQWVDSSTRIVFDRLVEWAEAARALIIATVRISDKREQSLFELAEGSGVSWLERSNVTVLSLPGLPKEEAKQLIALTAKGKLMPTAVVATVLERADGIPLYIEELTRGLVDPDTNEARENSVCRGGPARIARTPEHAARFAGGGPRSSGSSQGGCAAGGRDRPRIFLQPPVQGLHAAGTSAPLRLG